jgi:protein Mpv17
MIRAATIGCRGGMPGPRMMAHAKASFRRPLQQSSPHRTARATLCDKPVSASGGGIMNWGKQNPFTFQVVIATLKTSAADLLVQKHLEGREEIDWKRNAVFVAFGGMYLGVFQWWLYVIKFKQWFPTMGAFCNQTFAQKLKNTPGKIDLAKQVAFDNFVHYTFIYFPTFYIFKESIQADANGKQRSVTDIVTTAIDKYKTNFWGDNTAIWTMWIPMDAIIYAAPIWMRLPLNHTVSFAWTVILSFMRGGSIEEKNPEEIAAGGN